MKTYLTIGILVLFTILPLSSWALEDKLTALYDFALCQDLPVYTNNNIIGLSVPFKDDKLAPRLYEFGQLDENVIACVFPLTDILPVTSPTAIVGTWLGGLVYSIWLVFAVLIYFLLLPQAYRRVVRATHVFIAAAFIWSFSTLSLLALHHTGLSAIWFDNYAMYQIEDKHPQIFAANNVRRLDEQLLARGLILPPQFNKISASQAASTKAVKLLNKANVRQALNLREAPGTHHKSIAVLKSGSQVDVLLQSKDFPDWWQIQTVNGLTGWASSLWLTIDDEHKG